MSCPATGRPRNSKSYTKLYILLANYITVPVLSNTGTRVLHINQYTQYNHPVHKPVKHKNIVFLVDFENKKWCERDK